MKQQLLIGALVVLLVLPAASAKVFYYSDEVDYQDNLAYAHLNHYDGIDADDFVDFDDYTCVSLDDQRAIANANQYDHVDPWTAATISRQDLKKLSQADRNRIADENPYDAIDRDDVDSFDDFSCSTLRDYNDYARTNAYDRYDEADFTRLDHIEIAQEVGKDRYHFFELSDFDRFNLNQIRYRPVAKYLYPGYTYGWNGYYYNQYGSRNAYPVYGAVY